MRSAVDAERRVDRGPSRSARAGAGTASPRARAFPVGASPTSTCTTSTGARDAQHRRRQVRAEAHEVRLGVHLLEGPIEPPQIRLDVVVRRDHVDGEATTVAGGSPRAGCRETCAGSASHGATTGAAVPARPQAHDFRRGRRFWLHGDVLEPERLFESLRDVTANFHPVCSMCERHVNGERVEAIGDAPDVQVVDRRDAPEHSRIALLHRGDVDVPRRRLEQNRRRLAKHAPAAVRDEHRDTPTRRPGPRASIRTGARDAAALIAPIEPSASVATCASAARTFKLPLPARARITATSEVHAEPATWRRRASPRRECRAAHATARRLR